MSPVGHALVAVLASAALAPAPLASPGELPGVMDTERSVLVGGSVLDYARRPVVGARVSGSGPTGAISVETDGRGQFRIRVSPGTHLSATKGDMLGSVVVSDAAEQTVVIVMKQMPI